ncbi:hypothetical protein [Novosphingobium sp. JCM 18896]|uniref:hypothetical protein n=1 Tax=Novosphingobium sp. JCM 18896 TaxID=2989731 RepID=UPI0022226D4D|nr:hypothetical protein [Novosphingobium sp. JCM 18896]MCW1431403.1 hypothetical protein [Novosphingobium sp. JCM 18896]
MAKTVNAVVTRARGARIGDEFHEHGATVTLPQNQFDDLGPDGIGWVDKAGAKTTETKADAKPA